VPRVGMGVHGALRVLGVPPDLTVGIDLSGLSHLMRGGRRDRQRRARAHGIAGWVVDLDVAAGASAGAHAGEIGGDGVGGVSGEVGLGHVVAHRGAWVGVAHRLLHVPDGDPGDEAGRAEGAPQPVRADRLADAGGPGDPGERAAGTGAVHPPPGAGAQDRPGGPSADRLAHGAGRGSAAGCRPAWRPCRSRAAARSRARTGCR